MRIAIKQSIALGWCSVLLLAISVQHATVAALAKPVKINIESIQLANVKGQIQAVTAGDSGELFIHEQMTPPGHDAKTAARIIRLTINGRGQAIKQSVFAENMPGVTGMLWHNDALHVMHPPQYTRLIDEDHDGQSDRREKLEGDWRKRFSGVGEIASLGEMRLGMDGRIYFSAEIKVPVRNGNEPSARRRRSMIARMKPNGSDLEPFDISDKRDAGFVLDQHDRVFAIRPSTDATSTLDSSIHRGRASKERMVRRDQTWFVGSKKVIAVIRSRNTDRSKNESVSSDRREGVAAPVVVLGGDALYWDTVREGAFSLKAASIEKELRRVADPFYSLAFVESAAPLQMCVSSNGKYLYIIKATRTRGLKSDHRQLTWHLVRMDVAVSNGSGDADGVAARIANRLSRVRMSVDELLAALKNSNHRIRLVAQFELIRRGSVVLGPTRKVLWSKQWPTPARVHALWVMSGLADQSPREAFDPTNDFFRSLHNGPPQLRAQAARAIGLHRLKAAARGMTSRRIYDSDPEVRAASAIALGRIGEGAAVAELFASLDDDDERARKAKVHALQSINQWSVAPGFLNSSSRQIRSGVLLALSGMADRDAVAALVFAVENSPYEEVRLGAVAALARVAQHDWKGNKDVINGLKVALRDEVPSVRHLASQSLGQIKTIENNE